jgi:hypothetical protein
MKVVKTTAEYTVFQRGDGRYAVRAAGRKWINGEDKVEILYSEGLLKKPEPKAEPEPEPEAEEAAAEGDATEE